MSQSPSAQQAAGNQIKSYTQRWQALYELVDEGKSWSGHERHCCFLNVQGRQFADISAASNLDNSDDGRAVAVCDWNHDGKVDFWISNRNGPRLRLMGNRTRSSHNYVALRLVGKSCNRDAIGSRVEISCNRPNSEPLIKTLHAGDGYLAQSSKWMHFGLGEHQEPIDVRVNWPDGKSDVYRNVRPNQFCRLVQHTDTVLAWQPPTKKHVPLIHDPITGKTRSSARTWVVGRIPIPRLTYADWTGKQKQIQFHNDRPLLVNLWSSDCSTCMRELSEWSNEKQRFSELPLGVLALNVDDLVEPVAERQGRRKSIEETRFFGGSGLATPQLIDILEITHRSIVELKKPLPVPCSFLFDRHGHLAAVYKGPVAADRLAVDVELLDATPAAQRNHAIPFSGRWLVKPGSPSPRRLIASLIQAGKTNVAVEYLLDYLKRDDTLKSKKLKADLYELYANMLWDRKQFEEAAESFSKLIELAPEKIAMHREIGQRLLTVKRAADGLQHLALAAEHSPGDSELQMNIGIQALNLGNTELAIEKFRLVLAQRPNVAMVHFHLGNLLVPEDPAMAVKHYRQASKLEPASPASNNLAWILATHSDAQIRNGAEAVNLAVALCKRTGYQDVSLLDTLAAAYAETKRFEDAVRTIEMAIKILQDDRNSKQAQRLQSRLVLYQKKRPYRE